MATENARKQLQDLVLHAQFAAGESLARQIRDDAQREQNQELAADAAFVLGQCCFEQLRYQDAWDAFADVLADRSELYGPNHLRTNQARAWLAGVCISLQRNAEAKSMLERAKAAVPAQPMPEEMAIAADTLKAIGFTETRLNDARGALGHLRRSLEIIEMAKDADELEVAGICVILGMAEQTAKHFDRAEALYQRALDIRVRRLGEDNQLVAYCRKHVGIAQMLQGGEGARALMDASVASFEGLPVDKPSTANRGSIVAHEEDHMKAIDTLEKALITKGGADTATPDVAQTLVMMGLMQLGFEQPALAEPHLRRATEILLPLHQTQLDTLFNAFNNTLMALNAQRKFKDIIIFAEKILDTLQKEVIVDAGFLAAVMAGISSGYYGQKKYAKAEKLLRRALGVIESRLGPNARELEPILQNLAQLLEEMGRKSEARTYARRCEEIQAQPN